MASKVCDGVFETTKARERVKKALIKDSFSVRTRAVEDETEIVPGRYSEKRNGKTYTAQHIVDEQGNVKLSYFESSEGVVCIAAGRDFIYKHVNLYEYFDNVRNMNIEFDVYRDR